ncbi:MAG: SDR family oxidoreductase [Pseudomonadota bacterium]
MTSSPSHPVAGQTAFITGASRGIGEATARELASLGARVVLAARSAGRIEAIASEINDMGGRALAVPCDVADRTGVQSAIQKARDVLGPVTILINNAGVIEPIASIADSDPEAWTDTININLLGPYYCVHEILSDMRNAKHGTIINISSGAANNALEGWSHYCTSKAGLKMFTQALHKELASHGIRALGLSPGTVATEMQVQIKASGVNPVSQLDPSVHIPSEWVAKTIAWLCTDDADPYLGTDVSLRLDEIRSAVGLL